MRRLSTFLAALCVVASGVTPVSAQGQQPTSPEQIQVWNTSLKLVNSTAEQINDPTAPWRDAFEAMGSSEYQYRPDLITVLEVPFKDQDEVKQEIELRFGEPYGSVHSDYGVTFCENNRSNDCGNTLLVWRAARFSKVTNASGVAEVQRWAQYDDNNGDGDCDDSGDLNKHETTVVPDQIAAKLKDAAKGKTLVLAGLHLANGAPPACVAKNLKKVSDHLESTWPNRPLTVVTGDFNEPVDPHHLSEESTHWRPETDTGCWYEQFSALHPDRSTCQLFTSWYYDAIWAENAGANPSDGICRHWTIGNLKATYSTADGCGSAVKRIDYIWVRYEDSTGARQELSLAQIQQKIEEAGTDRYQESTPEAERYSDHRALYTRVLW